MKKPAIHPVIQEPAPPGMWHTQDAGPLTRFLPVFQMLDAAETFEPPIHHDGQAGTERLTFLHAGETGQV